jgi:hypothetical protein
LLGLRIGLAVFLPFHLAFAVMCWGIFIIGIALLPLVVVLELIASSVPRLARWRDRLFSTPEDDPDKRHLPRFARRTYWVELFASAFVLSPWALVARVFAIRDIRKQMTGYLVSRPCITGAGSLADDGHFVLSEKAHGIRRIMRVGASPDARGIYDLPSILKAAGRLVLLRPRAFVGAFRRRQRLQISLSDSNMAQVAEYLKVGMTLVVLDMLEAGALVDAPLPVDPIAALNAINADPTLRTPVPIVGGGEMTALQLQRWYLECARKHVATAEVVAMDAHEVVRLWGQALDALESDPGTLVGKLDWITKRLLIEQCADDDFDVKKKIDLRYHEITDGYFRQLEKADGAARMVDEHAVRRAMKSPPDGSPAAMRGRLIAELADSGTTTSVNWERVRIGGVFRGKVIRLDDHR